MKYSKEKLARLRAIQEHYRNTPKTPLPNQRIVSFAAPARRKPDTDVFGNPLSRVSDRVQRVRDLKQGVTTMVWHKAPARPSAAPLRSVYDGMSQRDHVPASQPAESFDDWTKRMSEAVDRAADCMEGKTKGEKS